MKNIAFLLLALTLAACSTPQELAQKRAIYLARAENSCAQLITPADRKYWGCVKEFAALHDELELHRNPDGSRTLEFVFDSSRPHFFDFNGVHYAWPESD